MNIETLTSRIEAQKSKRMMINLNEEQKAKLESICSKMGYSPNKLIRAAIEEIFDDLFNKPKQPTNQG